MIKKTPQIIHVEETVNIKWCVSNVSLYSRKTNVQAA